MGELTFGQKAVGINFNPSGNPKVDKIKKLYAEIIDTLVDENGGYDTDNSLAGRCAGRAVNDAIGSQMWAVKALTLEQDKPADDAAELAIPRDVPVQHAIETKEASIEAAPTEKPKDKRVVRTKSSGDRVYLLDEIKKTRQWVYNPEVLDSLGFTMGDVQEVEDSEILKYGMGAAILKPVAKDAAA